MTDWVDRPTENGTGGEHSPAAADEACTSSSGLSVAEMVAQTASQFVSEQLLPGFVYLEEYSAYYNGETGYFYDPKSCLFFHPSTQCYYMFNEHTNQYEVYSPNPSEQELPVWTKKGFRKRAQNLMGQEFVQSACQEDIEVMELALDLVDRCSFLAGDYCGRQLAKRTAAHQQEGEDIDGITVKRPCSGVPMPMLDGLSSEDEGEEGKGREEAARLEEEEEWARRMAEEEMAREAPCIRLVERPANRLHIVTILGADVGFGPGMDIQLDGGQMELDRQRQGPMLRISYEEGGEGKQYRLEMNMGAGIPVHLDGQPIRPGTSHALGHEQWVQLGQQHCLLAHIHAGTNTCQGCEPGLFPTSQEIQNGQRQLRKYSKNAERRRQNRALKEQYGLLLQDDSKEEQTGSKYVDRAKVRRKTVGSVPPGEGAGTGTGQNDPAGGIYSACSAAPVPGSSTSSVQLRVGQTTSASKKPAEEAIEESNKGFQLLKGMGWKAGQGLGKNNQGIQGPIGTVPKADRAGLGMAPAAAPKISIRLNERQEILQRTRQRYEQIGEEGGKASK